VDHVATIKFTDYGTSVTRALDAIAAEASLPQDGLIIIKPNLTNADTPPVTTPVDFVEAVYAYFNPMLPIRLYSIIKPCDV